jgi:hypothetical protein
VRGTAVVDLAAHASVLGLVLTSRLIPGPGRLRDAGQLRYLNAYREVVAGAGWRFQLEARVGASGDPRAIDLLLVRGRIRVAHEFVTRLRDVQAQVRPMLRKAEDARVDALVLVLADTRTNREAVAQAGGSLRELFPLGSRAVLAAIRAGRAPAADGLLFVRALPPRLAGRA